VGKKELENIPQQGTLQIVSSEINSDSGTDRIA
jgi:hypothetical protein